jgi:hypothetical protein
MIPTTASMSLSDLSSNAIKPRKPNAVYKSTTSLLKKLTEIFVAPAFSSNKKTSLNQALLKTPVLT